MDEFDKAPAAVAETQPTPPEQKPEPKRQATIRMPVALFDRIEAQRPPGEDLNPFIVSLIEKALDTPVLSAALEQASGATALDALRHAASSAEGKFIGRQDAVDRVMLAINSLVSQSGSRIDTMDREGNPPVLGLRTLVRKALLGE